MSAQVRFDEKFECDTCGRYGAFDFGDERLCGDCYEARCSCCPEFGERDAWKTESHGNQRDPSAEPPHGPSAS